MTHTRKYECDESYVRLAYASISRARRGPGGEGGGEGAHGGNPARTRRRAAISRSCIASPVLDVNRRSSSPFNDALPPPSSLLFSSLPAVFSIAKRRSRECQPHDAFKARSTYISRPSLFLSSFFLGACTVSCIDASRRFKTEDLQYCHIAMHILYHW